MVSKYLKHVDIFTTARNRICNVGQFETNTLWQKSRKENNQNDRVNLFALCNVQTDDRIDCLNIY